MNDIPRLMPLRIPSGWTVVWNGFLDVEEIDKSRKDQMSTYIQEDMLMI
jgi:hypothetical protein